MDETGAQGRKMNAARGWTSVSKRAPMSANRRLMVGALLVPTLLMLGALCGLQYRAQRDALLLEQESMMQRRLTEVDSITAAAEEHVINMRHWMEGDLAMVPPSYPSELHRMLRPRHLAGQFDGYTLDDLKPAARDYLGQFLWIDRQAPTQADLNRFAYFSGPAAMAHALKPYFAWSYFFASKADVFIIYPWTPARTFVEDQGQKSLNQAMRAWLDYDVFKLGKPAVNPTRSAYWVQPYVDAGGKGLMVSHAAPVTAPDGSFRGIVGTDVLLDTLQDLVLTWRRDAGHWWVRTEQDQLLADSGAPLIKAGDVEAPLLSKRLPPELTAENVQAAIQASPKPVDTADGVLLAVRSAHAPWVLLHHLPQRAIWAALWPNLWPYAQMILLVLASFVLGLILVQRQVMTPALAVLDYLLRRMRHEETASPAVGRFWQPVLEAVETNFDAQDRAGREQRRSEALKSAVVDNALFAVVTTDEKGRIVEFNPAAEQLFNIEREQAIGKLVSDFMVPSRYRQAHLDGMARMEGGGTPRVIGKKLEMQATRADGTEIPVEMVLARSEVDGEVFYSALLSDLSERKRVNAEVERQREALRQSEKLTAMGSLLAGVAHELNNPLAILMGRATLLESKVHDEALRGDTQRIREAAERCGRIVKTFLNMARNQGGERRLVQLNDMVRGAVDLMAYSLRTTGVVVNLKLAQELPEVHADGDQLGQIILNLLVNAQQAPGVTQIQVTTGIDPSCQAGGEPLAWLRVCDNGPGVPADMAQRIFDPFFTTKPMGTGTGLGLSVSRAIARDHGGDLLLDHQREGEGACFVLRLPLSGAALKVSQAQAITESDEASSAFLARILVVDDEAELADVMRAMLESQGYEVLSAESGQVALEILAEATCDLILSDLRMPVMDGPALWREVKQHHPDLARRMIFVTGDTLSAGAREFLKETGCACIEKPFSQQELICRVKDCLNG